MLKLNAKEEILPVDFAGLRQNSRLQVTDDFIAPPVILRIGDSIVGTLGNFSASTGKAKSKKTFNVCAIVASALSNNAVLNYSASFPENKRRILYVDTEQSKFHCQKILKRILLLAGLPGDVHPETLEFLSLRKFSPKTRLGIIEEAICHTENLGLAVIDGVRDLAYDINSPSEATDLITRLMQWTDERQIHIHTVLHLNKGDDNTRGHLGTELNNKAETVLQITRDEFDKDISSVAAMYIRDIDFEPFAFRINENSLPEPVNDYQSKQPASQKSFDYLEVPENTHREALENIFSEAEQVSYTNLIGGLQKGYESAGYSFGTNKAKLLKVFLESRRTIIKDGRH
ncbi:MAG: AAA family ATPase [Prevotellaceae bacterium]|nr:AAA family ATPase [Prevotellaceae bacterium]